MLYFYPCVHTDTIHFESLLYCCHFGCAQYFVSMGSFVEAIWVSGCLATQLPSQLTRASRQWTSTASWSSGRYCTSTLHHLMTSSTQEQEVDIQLHGLLTRPQSTTDTAQVRALENLTSLWAQFNFYCIRPFSFISRYHLSLPNSLPRCSLPCGTK